MDRFFYSMRNLHGGCAETIKRVTSITLKLYSAKKPIKKYHQYESMREQCIA